MKAPLGKNEVGKFLSTTAKNAGPHREGKKVTNHSVRKTCISRLLDADVLENFVAQLSGHKNTKSLQSFKSASAKSGFIQKIATIFQGVFKDHIRFSRTTY